MVVDMETFRLTSQLLHHISSHISNRDDYRKQTYRVVIPSSNVNPQGFVNSVNIQIEPNIFVFPDTYHRKQSDKCPLINHIVNSHIPELDTYSKGADPSRIYADGVLLVDGSNLIPGTYEYQSSIDNKKRRWVKVNPESL